MVLALNKQLVFFSFLLGFAFIGHAQEPSPTPGVKEYKDKEQFEKFYKRRKQVASWQITQLKKGALVVRLRTGKKLVDALIDKGEKNLARDKAAEQFIINKNTMMAYRHYLHFCKVYFIYSNSSDSLLNGVRQGIFLDSNLKVNPEIVMTESFYLLAERDYAFNSSIGFVKEDSAKFVVERGNPVKEMGVVVKNKYGHQLKGPFPYYEKDKNYSGFMVSGIAYSLSDGQVLTWTPLIPGSDDEGKTKYKMHGEEQFEIKIKKQFTYEKIAEVIARFNGNLFGFYRSAFLGDESLIDAAVKPFCY